MQRIPFYIFYGFSWTITWLPLSVLYRFSTIIYYLIYFLVKYRRKVVRNNLTNAFPEKDIPEIIAIEKAFYRHLCDFFVETIKLLHISIDEMNKRLSFTNMEVFDRFYREGKSVILYTAHYGNWEWATFGGYVNEKKNKGNISRPVYFALKNKYFDGLFYKFRSTFGSEPIETKQVFRKIIQLEREKALSVFTFVADQTPNRANIHHWMTFLNQDTPVITGTERIAKQTGYAVVFFDIQPVKRGYYNIDAVLICEDARDLKEFELTEKYMRLVEKSIQKNPPYWLWTHKRWKHKRIN